MQTDTKVKTGQNSLAFIKDVAKYFMDFLETDFHKRRNPKRSVQLRNNDNLLVGIDLNKYSSFNNLVWKTIIKAFDGDVLNNINKGIYKTSIPNNLLDLVDLQVSKISSDKITDIIKKIGDEIEKAGTLYKKEYDKALVTSLENISVIIKEDLVLPFISHIEKPIENLDLADENTVYLMEEELTSVLLRLIENKVSALLNTIVTDKVFDSTKELKSVFKLADIKSQVTSFFSSFQVGDLFSEVFEMERNRKILDKQEFYLYFCDITFAKIKYPIFYIPFSLEIKGDKIEIQFDSQVYLNKKVLEYISQQYNKEKGTKGSLQTVSERIIYLAQNKDNFREIISSVLDELVNFFDLDSPIDTLDPTFQSAKSLFVRISNRRYISLFDKSDEALVNDYEEILELLSKEDSVLAEAFNRIIEDFITKNPINFNSNIENDWDELETTDKLVFKSPIPLNGEQLQILSALKKEECNYITVEGPPGTGKSHTITAIVFDAILNNQSVLVLSDKKEALDVVEDKITNTLKSVRIDDRFQNPILRLGKIGSNYAKILSKTSIGDIKNHHRALKKNYSKIQSNIDKFENTLKEDIEAEIQSYGEIDIGEIYELHNLEEYYNENGSLVDLEEIDNNSNPDGDLFDIREVLVKFKSIMNSKEDGSFSKLLSIINISPTEISSEKTLSELNRTLSSLNVVKSTIVSVKKTSPSWASIKTLLSDFCYEDIDRLRNLIKRYEDEKGKLFKFAFKKKIWKKLNNDFVESFPTCSIDDPFTRIEELQKVLVIYNDLVAEQYNRDKVEYPFDYIKAIHSLLVNEELNASLDKLVELGKDINYLVENVENYKNTLEVFGINKGSAKNFLDNKLIDISEDEFNKLIRFIHLRVKINKSFGAVPDYGYYEALGNIEDLVTAKMTYLLDGRVIKFYEENQATARVLKEIIKNKQRFPKKEFSKLKEAFPCILAGIRDYAEYIPLNPGIFDLVIIDEASQVSIAQAFPALLRAKRVLVLGDNKQFSNVKASHARSDTNKEYLNHLEKSFKKNVSEDDSKLVKLGKFNIKTSILEFFEFISNYQTQLRKHFRGYKEIISYSNKYFYQDSLEVMKIRGKSIDDVLKFSFVKDDGKKELIPNTNNQEIDFIIKELQKIKEQGLRSSIGIITPHTNQQKLLMERISKLPEKDYFFEKLNLKIMTFDTCQGEERDIIFYSMVATSKDDKLWGVFIKDLSGVDLEEDGQIKAQRLNVGFSRAKEQIHLVLSKGLDEYKGSIGEALRYYSFVLEESKKESSISETDSKSKMEPEVMNWFYQTKFWKENKDHITFIPQFNVGKYLRQIDSYYDHPEYEVDFLLVYKDKQQKEHKVIIEYDGFREHFMDIDGITEFNFDSYYKEEDVYRQKVLEGYGYKFLRINKFNVGNKPIEVLNERILKLVNNEVRKNNILVDVRNTVNGLEVGSMKECPKCKKVREFKDFEDYNLLSGYGRFCNVCKNKKVSKRKSRSNLGSYSIEEETKCPRCGSRMVARTGRYGRFYGCSKYPYCKGTRQFT
ncbi:MAG: AAA domain-containing protein [Patescibacteria group bacterium]